jgi:hypothetical protein
VRTKAGLTILAIAAAAAGGSATAGAPRPQQLAQGRDLGAHTLAGNGAGGRVVVIERDLVPRPSGVDVFTAAPGAKFGPAVRLRGDNMPANSVSAAVGPDGTVALVGAARTFPLPDSRRLRAVVGSPGTPFGKPATISRPGADEASVAFDSQGTAMAIWTRDANRGAASYIEESTRPPGGDWSEPTVISYEQRGATEPQVAFDAAGDALAVWARDGSPEEALAVAGGQAKRRHARKFKAEIVAARRAGTGTAFGRPQVVSDPRFDSAEASLSVNSRGQAAIAWVLNTPGDKHFRIGAAFRDDPGERFGKPRFLTPDGRDSYGTSLALDEHGRALVVWTIVGDRPDMASGANQVVAAIRQPGGALDRPVKLSDRHTGFPEMAMSPDGHAVVTWVRESRYGYIVQARRVTTAGAYGPITQISPRGDADELHAAVADGGSALVTWIGDAHPGRGLEAAALTR